MKDETKDNYLLLVFCLFQMRYQIPRVTSLHVNQDTCKVGNAAEVLWVQKYTNMNMSAQVG